jgi:predicted metal-binding membrane protein
VLVGLAALSGLAWAYTAHTAAGMSSWHMAMSLPEIRTWSARDLGFLFVMWAVMMTAMMLPSAAPIILLVAGVNRRRRERADPTVPTASFVLGYLLIWTTYAAMAAGSQLLLHNAALLSPGMVTASPWLGGGLLLAAGIYQWTPLKEVCLHHCRSPLHFLSTEWREGTAGALRMGFKHGAYCVGCCWLLMALLFVAGVMNLVWVAALAAFVLAEKVVPGGRWVGRVAGLGFLGWGAWLMTTGA